MLTATSNGQQQSALADVNLDGAQQRLDELSHEMAILSTQETPTEDVEDEDDESSVEGILNPSPGRHSADIQVNML